MKPEVTKNISSGRSVWDRIKSFIANLRRKSSSGDATASKPPETDAVASAGFDNILTTGLYRGMNDIQQFIFEKGKDDGALGIKVSITAIARCKAQEIYHGMQVMLKDKTGALKARLESKEKIMRDDEKLHTRELAYFDYLRYQYRFFPRSHSVILFILYMIVSLALIIADMPLALELIQKGFNLPGPGYEDLFKSGNFWETVKANWETSLTALGVALCTIYIKIFYDEFIGTPYANKLMISKKFIEENGFDGEKINQKIVWEHMLKVIVKIALFAGTIIAILFLAKFRIETARSYNDGSFKDTFISRGAFISITLLFPVIGGICLSYALNNLQNLLRYAGSKRRSAKSRRVFLEAVEAYTAAKGAYEDIIIAGESVIDKTSLIEEYTGNLIAFYNRGHLIGSMQPEKYMKGEELFNKILEARNITITRKINHYVANLN